MAEFEDFTDEFTQNLRDVIVGDRVHEDDEPLPSFHPDLPVGSVAHWDDKTVIVRVSEHGWQFKGKIGLDK